MRKEESRGQQSTAQQSMRPAQQRVGASLLPVKAGVHPITDHLGCSPQQESGLLPITIICCTRICTSRASIGGSPKEATSRSCAHAAPRCGPWAYLRRGVCFCCKPSMHGRRGGHARGPRTVHQGHTRVKHRDAVLGHVSEERLGHRSVPGGALVPRAQGQNHPPQGGRHRRASLGDGYARGRGHGGALGREEGQLSWRDEVARPDGEPHGGAALLRGVR